MSGQQGPSKGRNAKDGQEYQGSWRSSHKARLGVGLGGHQPRRKIGAVRLQGLGGRGVESMAEKQGGILGDSSFRRKEHCT